MESIRVLQGAVRHARKPPLRSGLVPTQSARQFSANARSVVRSTATGRFNPLNRIVSNLVKGFKSVVAQRPAPARGLATARFSAARGSATFSSALRRPVVRPNYAAHNVGLGAARSFSSATVINAKPKFFQGISRTVSQLNHPAFAQENDDTNAACLRAVNRKPTRQIQFAKRQPLQEVNINALVAESDACDPVVQWITADFEPIITSLKLSLEMQPLSSSVGMLTFAGVENLEHQLQLQLQHYEAYLEEVQNALALISHRSGRLYRLERNNFIIEFPGLTENAARAEILDIGVDLRNFRHEWTHFAPAPPISQSVAPIEPINVVGRAIELTPSEIEQYEEYFTGLSEHNSSDIADILLAFSTQTDEETVEETVEETAEETAEEVQSGRTPYPDASVHSLQDSTHLNTLTLSIHDPLFDNPFAAVHSYLDQAEQLVPSLVSEHHIAQ